MKLENIMADIKVEYKDHEDLDSIISDLEAKNNITWWAGRLTDEEDFGTNKKIPLSLLQYELENSSVFGDCNHALSIIIEHQLMSNEEVEPLLEKVQSMIKSTLDYTYYAEHFSDNKEKMNGLYQRGIEIAQDFADYLFVSENIISHIEDESLALQILKQGLVKYEDYDSYFSAAGFAIEELENKDLAKDYLLKAAEFANDCRDYQYIAEKYIDEDIYDADEDEDESLRNMINDLWVMALTLAEDSFDKKEIKSSMKEKNFSLTAKFIKARGTELLKQKEA